MYYNSRAKATLMIFLRDTLKLSSVAKENTIEMLTNNIECPGDLAASGLLEEIL